LTYKTYETVFEPESIKPIDPLKLDISRIYTIYKRRYRRSMSTALQSTPINESQMAAMNIINSNSGSSSTPTTPRRSKRLSISFELENTFRNLVKHGEQLNNHKFVISTVTPENGKK
jgi:hypothetical protein